uniref:Antifreeze protein type IV n=1 Tax=Tetraodon nigroviridis TaxID=99883 RepID=H3CUT1_TETNG
MKVAVIVAVALLALAQGSFGQEASEVEKLGQYIDTLKTQILSSVNAQFLTTQPATTFHLCPRRTLQSQLEPVAAQLQEQLKSFTTSLEEQIKPMATNVQAQIQPMVQSFQDQITTFIKQLGE